MGTTMETTEIRREVWWFSRYVMSYSCDPIDCSLLGSCVHGIFRQEYWSGLPFPSPGVHELLHLFWGLSTQTKPPPGLAPPPGSLW